MARICLDASLVLAWLLPAERTAEIIDIWDRLLRRGDELLGPPLLFIEVTSVLRERMVQQQITSQQAEIAFSAFQLLPVGRAWPRELHAKAWEIAKALSQRKAYDAHYLALAEIEGCELWTADRRLYNAVGGRMPWVKLVGDR
ncbi:MAG: type II toxin-antitoxin system VapC family toxin [Chloroflexota bacterium]|nr:type II toxin-antitoxin system VapC family toxin [Chloroflexota bacterium]